MAEGPRRLRLISVAQFDKEYLKSGFQMLLLLFVEGNLKQTTISKFGKNWLKKLSLDSNFCCLNGGKATAFPPPIEAGQRRAHGVRQLGRD